MTIREWCFPRTARRQPGARAVSIVLRAFHLAAVGFLLGGHAYGAGSEALFPWLLMAVATGIGLIVTEIFAWGLYWFGMAKGISVLAKLALLLAIPFAWDARVPILLVALLGAAVTSHMPARLRNHCFLRGRAAAPASLVRRDLMPEPTMAPGLPAAPGHRATSRLGGEGGPP